ncbi:sulfate/molybdate ABC transporter ATP-binding protein [Roseivirga sp. E12]|uniref:sulfate/molybdate ABC transporter ATP-binding protein n=1 Tax=Roseivirga sp. E12 TaxID=2819237 RepID=UPI001ABCAD0F|nr:ABC transporter ATP-binding protein [Roseivirga sp. E12]MBO3697472.1 ABC transporter ATP-binding protein [Roseivirga sp. E12]
MIRLKLHKKLHANQGLMHLDVDLNIPDGNFTAIQGKSGAGKTSLLRMIAGLMKPEKGHIEVNENTWFSSDTKVDLPIQKRGIGYVFQDYALFPNMTVYENLAFALLKGDNPKVIDDLVDIMELGDLKALKPNILSGGQQQRVALARALVQKPKLLLLDEPLSALDNEIRAKLQSHILELHKAFNLTTIMVSHDNAEVLRLADDLLIMENGCIINQGKPTELLSGRSLSGKFQFTGQVVDLKVEGVVTIISVMVGKELVKVASEKQEVSSLKVGDTVLVASKAFNPVIQRLS